MWNHYLIPLQPEPCFSPCFIRGNMSSMPFCTREGQLLWASPDFRVRASRAVASSPRVHRHQNWGSTTGAGIPQHEVWKALSFNDQRFACEWRKVPSSIFIVRRCFQIKRKEILGVLYDKDESSILESHGLCFCHMVTSNLAYQTKFSDVTLEVLFKPFVTHVAIF